MLDAVSIEEKKRFVTIVSPGMTFGCLGHLVRVILSILLLSTVLLSAKPISW